jgi:hypothetical protein
MAIACIALCALPVWLRCLLTAAVALAGFPSVWRYVLLRGPRALRVLEWTAGESDSYYVGLGEGGRRTQAVATRCLRYGSRLWLLRFQTNAGIVQLFVETGLQEPRALRRLARRLFREPGDAEGGRSAGWTVGN